MLILGIDYGKRKIGLAIAPQNGTVAVPYAILRVENDTDALEKIKKVLEDENVVKIVVGFPISFLTEDELNKNAKLRDRSESWLQEIQYFIKKLQKETRIPIEIFDERMSTKEAQKLLRGENVKDDDAVAAMIILQSYLDKNL